MGELVILDDFWARGQPRARRRATTTAAAARLGATSVGMGGESSSVWAVVAVRSALLFAGAPRAHAVPAFDELVYAAHGAHPQHGDCTHYDSAVYARLWDAMAALARWWAPHDYGG